MARNLLLILSIDNNLSEVVMKLTLGDYIEQSYLPYFRSKIKKEKNYLKELSRINVILNSDIGRKDFLVINRNDMILFLSSITNERNSKKATANRYRTRLMAIYNFAITNDDCKVNPLLGIKKNRENPRYQYLSIKMTQNILEECKKSKNKELFFIVLLALKTGMRQGEILNLEYRNIKFDGIHLYSEQTKSCKRAK